MQVLEEIQNEQQHPLALHKDASVEVIETGRRKHRTGRRASRRKSSVISASDSNPLTGNTTKPRRKSSSNARYFTKHHKDEQENKNDSPALLSLMDIISEMKRLPSISGVPTSTVESNNTWKRIRRHSEPPNKRELTKSTINHTYEKAITSKPLFSNSFLALEEEDDDGGENNVEILVSPLSTNELAPKRARSQSVPNTLKPSSLSTTTTSTTTRKALYPAHLNVSEAAALVRARVLYSGILKVDMQDSSEANVECEELGASIYIFGSRNRNRAFDGDEVAVELVNVDDMLNERKTKRQARQTRRLSVVSQNSQHQPSLSSIPEDTIDLGDEIKFRPQYCGKVVCVLERPRNMLFSGTLSLKRPYAKLLDNTSRDRKDTRCPKIIWFIPADKRLPLVAVPIQHAPPDFIKYHEEYKNRIFVGTIQRWPASSLHPFGTIVKEIGWMGELGVHSSALMADHHIKDIEFSETVLSAANAIPQNLTPYDKRDRRDLTDEYVFTLSSSSDHDLDCAFSIKSSEDGIYEVGIHVSDVAHFVRLNTPLDREARERCCSVDLVDRHVSILPSDFTKRHCSFELEQEKIAFSVLCRLTDKGVLLHAWVGKSIIQVKEHVDPKQLTNEAKQLLKICQTIQANRFSKLNGLSLARSYMTFELAESGYTKEIHRVDQTDHDVLLQELLILANMEVGQKICCRFPDQALLYRQDAPKLSKLTMIQDYFENDSLTNSVQGLFKLVDERETSTERQSALNYMIRKSISPSKYFSAGGLDISKYHHYGFGSSICSIFTNPIHNYAAIHTQRQLGAALKGEKQESENFDEIDKIARHCNASQISKCAAEQDSKKLYIAAYVYRQCLFTDEKKLSVEAVVIGLNEESVDLYIPEYDLEISLTLDEQSVPKANIDYDSTISQFNIHWKGDDQSTIETISFLSLIRIHIQVDMKVIRPIYRIELQRQS